MVIYHWFPWETLSLANWLPVVTHEKNKSSEAYNLKIKEHFSNLACCLFINKCSSFDVIEKFRPATINILLFLWRLFEKILQKCV